MKASQIAVSGSYEDKKMKIIRMVKAILSTSKGKVVEYIERSATDDPKPLYWPLRHQTGRLPLREFAKWAARPAGTKKFLSEKKLMDWLRGKTDLLAKSR